MASNGTAKVFGWVIVIGGILYACYILSQILEQVTPRPKNVDLDKGEADNSTIDTTSELVAESNPVSAMVSQTVPENKTKLFIESQKVAPESSTDWHHSDNFHTVTYRGVTHFLTLYQSRAIEKLWKALQNRVPELHQAAILEGIDSCSKRLRDVFKSNMEAYRALIAPGERKGHFRLRFS